jgi:hypothetical protein
MGYSELAVDFIGSTVSGRLLLLNLDTAKRRLVLIKISPILVNGLIIVDLSIFRSLRSHFLGKTRLLLVRRLFVHRPLMYLLTLVLQ